MTFRYNRIVEVNHRLLVILEITVYPNTGTKWEVVITILELSANDMIMDDNKQSNYHHVKSYYLELYQIVRKIMIMYLQL